MILLPSFADSPVHRVLERAHEKRTHSRGRLLSLSFSLSGTRISCEVKSAYLHDSADISLFCLSVCKSTFSFFNNFNNVNDEEFCKKTLGNKHVIKGMCKQNYCIYYETFCCFFPFLEDSKFIVVIGLRSKGTFHLHQEQFNR